MPEQEPHPGRWDFVLGSNQCELNTVKTAVHSCLIYNQSTGVWKVLYFTGFPEENSIVRSRIWNPSTNQITSQTVPNWPGTGQPLPIIFCSGHAYLADGRLLVAGGSKQGQQLGLKFTYIFNPGSETWSVATNPTTGQPQPMADGRYYPTLTTLGEDPLYGRILAMSGNLENQQLPNKDPEIYNPVSGWSKMQNPGMAQQPFDDWYPSAHIIPFGVDAGKVFYSSPMKQAYKFNPYFDGKPNGSYWYSVGNQRTIKRNHCNSVLLPLLPGSAAQKVLIAGGADDEFGTGLNSAEIINLSDSNPQWTSAGQMAFARINANAIILPNDTILLAGGNQIGQSEAAIFRAEIYDVETGTWRLAAPAKRRRAYHSTAFLMPDGKVWMSGTLFGNPPPIGEISENNIEIYSPGYLFEGTKPEFMDPPPSIINYGSQFSIKTTEPIAAIRLIRFGSVTHSLDMDQRSVGLSFTPGPLNHGYPYTVTAPANANIAPPGLFMLFVLRPKSASSSGQTMIPSEGKIVRLQKP